MPDPDRHIRLLWGTSRKVVVIVGTEEGCTANTFPAVAAGNLAVPVNSVDVMKVSLSW